MENKAHIHMISWIEFDANDKEWEKKRKKNHSKKQKHYSKSKNNSKTINRKTVINPKTHSSCFAPCFVIVDVFLLKNKGRKSLRCEK